MTNAAAETTLDEPSRSRGLALVVAGFLIACLGATCGIGGGLYAVPILHYLLGVPLKRAVATSLCLVTATALAATVTEAIHPDSAIFWTLVAALVVGALIGAQVGFRVAQRTKTRTLKLLFCVALTLVGLRLMLASGSNETVPQLGYVPDWIDHGTMLTIGLAAGFVVPVLGVGGGLVVVPAVLFGLPEIGYLGARASSLAMATITASRSVWLYAKKESVHWPTARAFAGGALGGAVVGVWLVHKGGVAEIGQVLLGATLCLAAIRFGFDYFVAKDGQA